MKYLINVIDDATASGTPDEMVAIDAFNDGLRANGHWVYAAGLTSPQDATVIDNRAEAGLVVDGPFVETKEWIAGFWIIDAPDRETALALATAGSNACNRRVEVRPFLER